MPYEPPGRDPTGNPHGPPPAKEPALLPEFQSRTIYAPDPNWLPFLKMTFGFLLLVMLAILAGMIAIGTVKQDSSHGLDIILGGLISLAGGFVNWAFTAGRDASKE